VVVRNLEHRIWWILDAKHGAPKAKNLATMKLQLKVAQDNGWIPAGLEVRRAFVHPAAVDPPPMTTDPGVVRITLEHLETLLIDTPNWSPSR
jgi:hypothetical protein